MFLVSVVHFYITPIDIYHILDVRDITMWHREEKLHGNNKIICHHNICIRRARRSQLQTADSVKAGLNKPLLYPIE